MPKIAIRLDPARMKNPDLDIRYKIPETLNDSTGGSVTNEGCEFVDGDKLVIFLSSDSVVCTATVLAALGAEEICGNHVLDSAVVGVDHGGGYEVVHPKGFVGD